MTTDQFLDFWSAHNISIIEGLIALILVMAAYISYRLIFAAPADVAAGAPNPHLDSAQIEKTLQKILDAQGTKTADGAVAGPTTPEIEELRQTLKTNEAEIAELKTQLAAAQASGGAVSAEGAAVAGGGAAAGVSTEERSALENKIHDLEARLAEYEIISEDIADLSRYKEENVALNQKLAALSGGAMPAEVAAIAAAPVAPAAPTAAPTPPVATPAPAEPAAVTPAAVEAASAPPATAKPAAAAEPASDDGLMKEFAAAIEGQTPKPEVLPPETDKLMSEFENFVKKG